MMCQSNIIVSTIVQEKKHPTDTGKEIVKLQNIYIDLNTLACVQPHIINTHSLHICRYTKGDRIVFLDRDVM